jgi:peptidoglycan/LPS O-acetylase OafA/YrhL
VSNLFPLLAGATVAAYVRLSAWRASPALGVLGVVVIAAVTLVPVTPSDDWMILRSLVTVVGAVMLLTRTDAWMTFAPLRYCGRISYGWYLWHVLFQFQLGGIEGALVSFGVAVLSFHLWESLWTRRSAAREPVVPAFTQPASQAA